MKRWIGIFAVLLLTGGLLGSLAVQAPGDMPVLQPAPVMEGEGVTLPIVMYHHLSKNPARCGDYVLSVTQFEQDLQYLQAQGYTTVTTAQLLDWCDGRGTLPEKPVLITFDDGYESTAVYALPLLEQYHMTGVVSVIGAITQQYTDLPDHNLNYSHMDWGAVVAADNGGVLEVQCHTYNMHRLSPRRGCGQLAGESDEAYHRALLADSFRFQTVFRRHTGHKATVLALPYGFYNKQTLEAAKALNFKIVFTCTERVNHLTGDRAELLELGRYNRPTGADSAAFFARWGLD